MPCVYLHTNRENGKVYVGQTWQNPRSRWRMQERDALKQKNDCRYLSAAIRKYGWAQFDHEILAVVDTQAELDNLEKVWIILLRAADPRFGYNLQLGGSRGRQSYETRKRISEFQQAHTNPGRFQGGHEPVHHFEVGHGPWNKGLQGFRHSRSFATGHKPYCNHLGGFQGNNEKCSRCGKARVLCA